jgi:hypothetical protein
MEGFRIMGSTTINRLLIAGAAVAALSVAACQKPADTAADAASAPASDAAMAASDTGGAMSASASGDAAAAKP